MKLTELIFPVSPRRSSPLAAPRHTDTTTRCSQKQMPRAALRFLTAQAEL